MHQARLGRLPASASRTASCLLGRELAPRRSPLATLLHVQARLVAVVDRRQHDADRVGVEQGDRLLDWRPDISL